jgi:hypothetical protein
MLVALRMLMASSDSCLECCLVCAMKDVANVPRELPRVPEDMMVVIYVLAHVDIARASVERHLGRRELSLRLVVDGRNGCGKERKTVGVEQGAQE